MKKNLKNEFRSKSTEELAKEIVKSEAELAKNRMDFRVGKLKNSSLLRKLADQLAALKTIAREKSFSTAVSKSEPSNSKEGRNK